MSGPALDRRVVEPSTRSFISRIYQCGPWGQTHLFSKAPFCPQLQGEQKPPIIAGLECGGACAVCVSVCGSLSPLGCHEERRLEESSRLCVWGGWIGGGKRVLFPPPPSPISVSGFCRGWSTCKLYTAAFRWGDVGEGGALSRALPSHLRPCRLQACHLQAWNVAQGHSMSSTVRTCHLQSYHVNYLHYCTVHAIYCTR